MLGKIAKMAANSAIEILRNNSKIRQAKTKAEVEVITRASKSAEEWERIMAKTSETSWKDEYVLFIMSLPFIGLYFAPERTIQWIENIPLLPGWFTGLFSTIALASFGIRATPKIIDRFFQRKGGK